VAAIVVPNIADSLFNIAFNCIDLNVYAESAQLLRVPNALNSMNYTEYMELTVFEYFKDQRLIECAAICGHCVTNTLGDAKFVNNLEVVYINKVIDASIYILPE